MLLPLTKDFFKEEGKYLVNLEDSQTAEYSVDKNDELLKALIYNKHDGSNPYLYIHDNESFWVYYTSWENEYLIIIEKV